MELSRDMRGWGRVAVNKDGWNGRSEESSKPFDVRQRVQDLEFVLLVSVFLGSVFPSYISSLPFKMIMYILCRYINI